MVFYFRNNVRTFRAENNDFRQKSGTFLTLSRRDDFLRKEKNLNGTKNPAAAGLLKGYFIRTLIVKFNAVHILQIGYERII